MPKRKTNETLVTFLLDKSGSMQSIKDDTIGAFNAYLDGLQTSGEHMTFSFLQFDSNSVDTICKNVAVAEVAPLTPATFIPGAATPLIDAAYETIRAVEQALANREGKPKVVICIQTDGQENASTAHTWADLNVLIKDKTGEGWQFNFMGAGIDAYQQGARMGIAVGHTMSYDSASPESTRAAFSATAQNTAMFASGALQSTAYAATQKSAAGDKYASPLKSAPQALHGRQAPIAKKRSLVDKISL